mmetsp:Transcript_26950/g.56425  ORF Transcript_26950/g.56425 Transcript_26950/m.56425 type:complete len:81 (-) Transcript_26950:86-328(-)
MPDWEYPTHNNHSGCIVGQAPRESCGTFQEYHGIAVIRMEFSVGRSLRFQVTKNAFGVAPPNMDDNRSKQKNQTTHITIH